MCLFEICLIGMLQSDKNPPNKPSNERVYTAGYVCPPNGSCQKILTNPTTTA